jgi:translation initiation factor 3 subunit F
MHLTNGCLFCSHLMVVLPSTLQDNLALVYLSSITRTQIAVAEKLNTAAQVL